MPGDCWKDYKEDENRSDGFGKQIKKQISDPNINLQSEYEKLKKQKL